MGVAARRPWANWGEVLRLEPLASEDAARLIAQPLARLGVDCVGVADGIAHRCGYQPAVLLRFGEQLVGRLSTEHGSVGRSKRPLEVQQADVVAVFESRPVADEITTIVRNNFQGNPIAKVVFAALLSEFLRFYPGFALENADAVVLEKLHSLSNADLSWLTVHGGNGASEILLILRDLVDRKLLVERIAANGSRSYSLRFPHHLPILAHMADPGAMRSDIATAKGISHRQSTEHRSGLFFRAALENFLSAAADRPTAELTTLSLVLTLWPEAAFHPASGLVERFGRASVARADEIEDLLQ